MSEDAALGRRGAMDLGDILWWQWLLGGFAAMLVGFGKTGVPGSAILVVPLMATVFGARPSVGILLPMLICADCFAVCWYRRHARWDHLLGLMPWVGCGLALGGLLLWQVDRLSLGSLSGKELFAPLIGGIVLLMLLLNWLRSRLGERLTPHSRSGLIATGCATGVASTLANAAGPIMSVYLASQRLPKEGFMGTNAWAFLLLNLSKVPIFLAIGCFTDSEALITPDSLTINACLAPLILPGVYLGRWLLPRLNQVWFYRLVVWLAAGAALKLVFRPLLGW
jgi:uncharacterized membrane protein YfcA